MMAIRGRSILSLRRLVCSNVILDLGLLRVVGLVCVLFLCGDFVPELNEISL